MIPSGKTKNSKPQRIPDPTELHISKRDYQPSKADLEEELEMPKLLSKRARPSFMRPFRFVNRPD